MNRRPAPWDDHPGERPPADYYPQQWDEEPPMNLHTPQTEDGRGDLVLLSVALMIAAAFVAALVWFGEAKPCAKACAEFGAESWVVTDSGCYCVDDGELYTPRSNR